LRILLHACCAPCLLYPLERLRKENFAVRGFFYNPNIYPLEEHERRREAVVTVSRAENLEVIYPGYAPDEFSRAIGSRETSPERCALCWRLRLKETARQAKAQGCDCFTTTLLVSPYQDQGLLQEIGSDVSQQEGVAFYYEDFRPGFRQAHDLAHQRGIYCQKYCGCSFSLQERCKRSEKR
jgi:epoxyqueuosine reductase